MSEDNRTSALQKRVDEINREAGDKGNGKEKSGEKKNIRVRHRTVQEIEKEEGIKISKIPKILLSLLIASALITGMLSLVALVTGHNNIFLYGITVAIYAILTTTLVVK